MIAGGNHTLIPNLPPATRPQNCIFEALFCRCKDTRIPGCPFSVPTAPANILRVRTVPRPPCAKGAVSEADWRIVLLKSRHFPVFQIAPCRGRYFLVRQESTQRTDPGRRFKCGLSNKGSHRYPLPRPQSALPWVPLPPLRVS